MNQDIGGCSNKKTVREGEYVIGQEKSATEKWNYGTDNYGYNKSNANDLKN